MKDNFIEDNYIIEQFTLDKETENDALKVVKKAFVNVYSDEGGTTEFTNTMFNILFNSPYIPRNLFVRVIYKPTGDMVGFLGGIPRELYYKGDVYKTAFPSFLSVVPEHRENKLAFKMAAKLIETGKSMGYEGGIAFFEPEEHGISTGQAIAREIGIPFITIHEINKFLIRIFNVNEAAKVTKLKWYEKQGLKFFQNIKKVKSNRVRKFKTSDGEAIYSLLEDFKEHNQMTFLRDKEDFLWYLQQDGVNCVVHENSKGEIDGFCTAFEFLLSGFGNSIKFGWIDVVHTYRIDLQESVELIKFFALTSKEMGWGGLQTPFIPYFDTKPFKKANFVFFPKDLIVAMFPLKKIDIDVPVSSFYFDWR